MGRYNLRNTVNYPTWQVGLLKHIFHKKKQENFDLSACDTQLVFVVLYD